MIDKIKRLVAWGALFFCAACGSHCSQGLVGPLPPSPASTLCVQACEICQPDSVPDCSAACERDQQSGNASQLNPAAVVEAGMCPNP